MSISTMMRLLDAHPSAELLITKHGEMYRATLREEMRAHEAAGTYGLAAAQQGYTRQYRELAQEQQLEIGACLHLIRNRLATVAEKRVKAEQDYLDSLGGPSPVEVP